MKMTVFLEGLQVANKNYYNKAKDDNLYLSDDTRIEFYCPENDSVVDCFNYAELDVVMMIHLIGERT